MNEKEETWRPPPAAKPSHLSSPPTTSTAALKGANSAFKPKSGLPKATATATFPVSASAKSAAVSAEDGAWRGRSDDVASAAESERDKRSPSRGRHPYQKNAQIAGARSAATTAALPIPIQGSSNRSTSAIAAKLASSNSSPVRRSPNRSPQRQESWKDKGALASAISSMATSPDAKEEQMSIRNRMLNFEKIPVLSPQKAPATKPAISPGLTAARSVYKSPSPPQSLVGSPPTISSRFQDTELERLTSLTTTSTTDDSLDRTGSEAVEPNLSPPFRTTSAIQQDVNRSKPAPPAPRRGGLVGKAQTGADGANLPVRDIKSGMTLNQLADSMVASSLASTRTPSPSKYHPSASRKRSASASELQRLAHRPEAHTRGPPQPPRPMKHTLRKHSSDNEEDEVTKRGRRHLVRKHPNMHHEGDRKRWRDKLSERERKRYEGVFAANRGLLLRSLDRSISPSKLIDPTAEGNQVVNLVVKDIWERSRLREEILQEIYRLVAPEEPQTLNREQFVVGLWLIDQKLKGRKLPSRVSQSVWASVRHSQGIKIRSKAM